MKPVKERIFEPFEEAQDLPPQELSIETSFAQTIDGSVKGKKVKKRVKKLKTSSAATEENEQPKLISQSHSSILQIQDSGALNITLPKVDSIKIEAQMKKGE